MKHHWFLLQLLELSCSARSIRAAARRSSCFAIPRSTSRSLTIQHHSERNGLKRTATAHCDNMPVRGIKTSMKMTKNDIDFDNNIPAAEITFMGRTRVLSYRLLLTGLAMAFTTNAIIPTLLEGSGIDTSSIEPLTRNAIAWMSAACVLCVPRAGINNEILSMLFAPLGITLLCIQVVLNAVLFSDPVVMDENINMLSMIMAAKAGDHVLTVLALCLICIREILFFGLAYKVEAALSVPLLLTSLLLSNDDDMSATLHVLTALTVSLLAASKVFEPILEDHRPGFSAFLLVNQQQPPPTAQPERSGIKEEALVKSIPACLIREITARDVLEIREEVLWPGRPEKCLVDGDNDLGTIHLGGFIVDTGELVGVVSLYFNAENWSTQFRKFAVRKEYQGKGIGSQILDAVKRYASRTGCKTLWAHAREHQEGFYARRGFVRRGNAFQKYEGGGMYVEMSMDLLPDVEKESAFTHDMRKKW